jgi:hypothetical protein
LAECTRAGVVIDAHPLPASRGSDPAARVRGLLTPLRNGHLTTLLNCTMCCSTSPIRGRVVGGLQAGLVPAAPSERRGSGDEMLRFPASRNQLADKIRRLALNSNPEDSQTIISLATDVITRGGADVRSDFSQMRLAGQPDEALIRLSERASRPSERSASARSCGL